MKKQFLFLVILSLSISAFAQTKLLRHPSYHNGRVAFSYLGDIWVGNEDGSGLQRLTVHKARDIYPRFSPDGKWIAFSSNRYGNYDVFVIPAMGGEAKQLTFHSGSDTVVEWAPDSKHVIFQANRGRMFPGIPSLYEVALDGGLERPLETDWGYWGGYSPDGKKLVFNRHPMVWWRKHYRGSYAADLWMMDVAQKKFSRLGDADYKGNYFWPMYGNGGDIYFVSDRLSDESKAKPGSPEVMKSVNNIWKMSDKGGKPVQVTHHTDGNLFFPTMSADHRVIVYEDNFGLWKLDTQTGKSTELKFNIVSDTKENEVETITVRNETEGYALSPTSKRAAVSAHGEIFTVATDQGDIQRVTQSFSRETNPEWSPDGKWIAFVSDKSGQDEVWIAREDGTGLKQITTGATEKLAIDWAADSKALLVSASDHKLYRYDLDKPQPTVLAQGTAGNIQGASFSPDGRWVAYSTLDSEMRPHAYVIASSGAGKPQHIGNDELQFAETSPRWTRDGRKIIFLAGVTQMGSAVQRRPQSQLFSVSLQKEEKALTDRGVDTEEEAAQAEREARARRPQAMREGADTGETAKEFKIDFDGISKRVHQITRLSDNVSGPAVSPDGRTYAFVGTADAEGRPISTIYSIQEDGTQLARLVQAAPSRSEDEDAAPGGFGRNFSELQFSRDGRSLFFLEAGRLNVVELGAAPTSTASRTAFATPRSYERKPVNFTVRVDVDHRAERKQVFAESWRIMKHRFYDAKMHGADWDAARATFEPMLEYVADQEEMHNVISEMIGELNASHTGISATPNAEERDHMVQSRYPGFELEGDPAGYYKVTKIYKDGPADHEYVKVHTGDFILAVDGHDLKANDNYWKFYNAPRGRKLDLLVNSKPTKEGAWRTHVEPVGQAAFTTLQYEEWVAQRRATVDKLSSGTIGYVHIRAMDAPSLRRFEREFVENHSKRALIIDQRFNPGGGIDQELLQILGQRQYQMTRGRDSIPISRPQQGFFGPMVVMQNERSTSDAEVFPDGFRTLGLGKVVGTPTYGAVIGTGAFRLLDGSSIRTPGTGLYNVKGYNLENYGVPPDVYVDNLPEDFLAGRDAQLEKAVEVLKEQIKGDKTRELQAGGGK